MQTEKVIKVDYKYKGIDYSAYLPINKNKVADMANMQMTLIFEDRQEPVSFQPGVYVMTSARMSGAKEIKVTDTFSTGTRVYRDDEMIGYM